MRMKLAWLSNKRPDFLLEISQLAQVAGEIFKASRRDLIIRLNNAARYAIDQKVPIRVPKLDKQSLHIIEFSDSSFANNSDLSYQLGHI